MTYAIIGAGIGGLTTALAFEKKGIDYHIFERAPQLSEVGAGIWLAPNALQVLEHLNVLGEVKDKGNSIDRIVIGKANLEPLSDNAQDHIKKKYGYSTVAIHRAELQKLLFNHIPKENITLGKAFQSYETLGENAINIKFEDASAYETEFLIGADGIHSKLRQHLFPNSQTRFSGQTCWRGVASMSLDEELRHTGMELWGNQIRFGISQIAEDKVYWFAVAIDKPNQKDDKSIIKHKLLEMFTDFHPLIHQLIKATPETRILRNDIYDLKPLDYWYKDTICLIGDAGHATTPNMGQGGAQAIEDAYYLSHLIESHPGENVFSRFQQKRQRKVNSIVKQSWTTGQMAHWKYGQHLRNFLLKHMPKSILEKKMAELYHLE